MKKTTQIRLSALIIAALFATGCASTHRLDGGRSAVFGVDTNGVANGTEIEGPRIAFLGSVVQLFSFTKRANLAASIDEPSASAGYTAASKTAMENASAQMTRSNGVKTVTYGAQGVTTDAQDAKGILDALQKLTPAGQVKP
jgi:hypothetical protein